MKQKTNYKYITLTFYNKGKFTYCRKNLNYILFNIFDFINQILGKANNLKF